MPINRFTGPLAVVLSLCTLTDAWALYHPAEKKDARKEIQPELRRHKAQDIGLERREVVSLYCPNDRYRQFLDNNPPSNVQTVCNQMLNIPPKTETVDYTPTM
jgi:hypothetical protein